MAKKDTINSIVKLGLDEEKATKLTDRYGSKQKAISAPEDELKLKPEEFVHVAVQFKIGRPDREA